MGGSADRGPGELGIEREKENALVTIREMTPADIGLVENKPFITVTKGMSGYFAVLMWWAPEHGGFWEPWQTGIGRYDEKWRAVSEAKVWAECEELEFKEPAESL